VRVLWRWRARKRAGPLAVVAVVALVVVVAVLGAGARPASAHASLVGSDPVPDSELDEAPSRVVLTFDSAVDASLGGIRLVDQRGRDVGIGRSRADGVHVVADLPGLDDGAYVVGWRVVSPDGHPIQGAFSFRVGAVGAVEPGVLESVLEASGSSRAVGVAGAVNRFVLYGSLAVVLGTAAMATVAPPWMASPRRRWRWLVRAGAATAVVASVAGIGIEAADAAGGALGDVADLSAWGSVVGRRFGAAAVVRVVALAAGVVLVDGALRSHRPARPVTAPGAAAAGAVIVGSVVVSGHAMTGRVAWLGVVADVVHVAAMAVWLGGLAALLVALGPLPQEGRALLGRRFSAVASGAVVAVVVSGVAQGWRQVGSLDELTGTAYGKLLLAKVAVVAVVVAGGGVSRWLVHRRGSPPTLRASVGGEVGLGAGVVVLTALLVHAVPAIDQRAQPFSANAVSGGTLITLAVDPIRAGSPSTAHLYLSSTRGTVQRVEDVSVRATLPAGDIGPLDLPLQLAGPNHYTDERLLLPLPGTWRIEVTGRIGEFEAVSAEFALPVR